MAALAADVEMIGTANAQANPHRRTKTKTKTCFDWLD